MQTLTKARLGGYWTKAAEVRNVECLVCGDVTAWPSHLSWKLVGNGDQWHCDECYVPTCEEAAVQVKRPETLWEYIKRWLRRA